ncbi:MAG TPA: hypothetical protein VFV42_06235, partial [Acidimicrobiales bacterium]|nr:hypothetical protein [Acidimicrobiales bacterium]
MMDTRRCGTTIVELGSGAPFGVLGSRARTRGLRFVEVGSDGADGDVVTLVPASRSAELDGLTGRFLAVAVGSIAELSHLALVDPDFVVLLPRTDEGADPSQVEAETAAIAAYARSRAIEVVGLGIDDQRSYDHLRLLGVRYGAGPHVEARLGGEQGLARSMSAHERRRWLRTRLDALATAPAVAGAACEHVAEIGLLP